MKAGSNMVSSLYVIFFSVMNHTHAQIGGRSVIPDIPSFGWKSKTNPNP